MIKKSAARTRRKTRLGKRFVKITTRLKISRALKGKKRK